MSSKTCRYCSQLVVPPNRGTLVVVKATCRGVCTTGCTPGVLNNRFSARIYGKSCCIRATMSTNTFSGDHVSFRRSGPTSLVRMSEREYNRNADLPQRESTQVRWGGRDGRREPCSLVLVAHRTTGRAGQATLGLIQTHSFRRLNSRRAVNAEQEVG